ncbi:MULTISPECIES: tetratricopeptide repeat-containing sensor histidine kinase [unclassified Tenacibaculum]|uniref:tetratricopeptide repeat-containing sensor histidine kinase n=1 Tax=unclassified Tenacibaculum TaxID=2635139 RepID=UPI001F1B1EE3|nr:MULTISPECIES: tetratricopeptide repeat-containing sensor histidine kinase [unclassified Tenacibaculum]MCF2874739.1 tetratricopeptide repeat protein [Tenacibaculum sp. Cn5-1]MCF2934195.1 tetratricopeptide repeat protein [Tenacibaculum sp. Cn5-34]MCG7510405.1 tetratricopeptide repeat protein [Tenacibaculum sp. Cn5-46]
MLKPTLFFVFYFSIILSYSQVKEQDSVSHFFKKSKATYGLQKLPLLKKAVFFAKLSNNDSLIRKANIEFGIQSFYMNSLKNITIANENIYNLYLKSKDSSLLAKHLHFKSLEQKIKLNIDSAYFYYHQSKNISIKIGDSLAVGRRLLSVALLQREVKDYLGAEISLIEALKYLEPINSNKFLERVYNVLGLITVELNQKEEALKYYNKALEYNKSNKNSIGYLYINNNIGLLYQKQNLHKKAISYFKKGLAFDSINEKYSMQYSLLLENLAYSNYQLKKKKNVLNQYEEVLNIKKKINNLSGASTTHINISNYYKDLKQNTKAKHHSKEALKYAKQTQNNNRWLEALKNLSELTTGKQSKAYLLEYISLNDSLFQKERLLKNQFAKVRYETGKKEKENAVLKTENEKKQAQIAYHQQQETIGWLTAASILLLLILSITFFLHRRRKLLYQAQLEAARARENERQQIAKSLHDEVAGDLRMLHQKLEKSNLLTEAKKLNNVKENVRNLSHQLSSVSFDEVSFKDQIINLVSDYFELDFKISVTGLQEYEWQEVNSPIKRLLYLGIRESIQNCKKYAQASKINIDLTIQKNYVLLNISDNGIGFDTKISKKGIGLRNLQERVEDLNGTLNISSKIGNGTKTNIQIPLNA